MDLHEERVAIAVEPQVDQVEDVPARIALLPKTPARAAVEMDLPGSEGRFDSLAIHIGEHQHGPGPGVLHDRRDQAALIEAHGVDHAASALGRTRTPRPASARLRSETTTSPE